MTGNTVQYSEYYAELDGDAKAKYEEKMRMIGLKFRSILSPISPLWNGMNGLKSYIQRFLIF